MTTTDAAAIDLSVDIQFMLSRISVEFTDDRYASAMYLGRRDAISAFEEKYGRLPDMERCTLEVQNSKDRVSVRLTEVSDEKPCLCGCHGSFKPIDEASLQKFMSDPDIGVDHLPWQK